MKSYHTEILLHAPIEKVWKLLTDFSSYPSWNPLIKTLTGELEEGGAIQLYLHPLNNTFQAKLVTYQTAKEMRWLGHRFAPFLLTGNHYYLLTSISREQTLLEHGEAFTGLLSFFLSTKLLAKMEQSFVEHNKVFKQRVEHG